MNFFQALILGLCQGLTEFIPVSSSAHLVLVPWLLGWGNPGLAFDTVLHLGTLVAVAWARSIRQRSLAAPSSRTAWALVIGTVPAAVLGVAAADFFESLFNTPGWVAALLLVTGFLLLASERWASRSRALEEIGVHHALLIGLAQAFAIAPGLSRSGATISAGRFAGLSRTDAARFSFLLATPTIAGAGALQVYKLSKVGLSGQSVALLLAGFLAALISSYLIIRFLLSYLQRHSLLPFAVYCGVVGFLGLLVWFAH